jgi:hypothetical protein
VRGSSSAVEKNQSFEITASRWRAVRMRSPCGFDLSSLLPDRLSNPRAVAGDVMSNRITDFEGGQTVNTKLTPNANCIASASGDDNDDTQLAFQYDNNTTYWSPAVSSGSAEVTNDRDRGNATVRFLKGLTVTYLPQAGGLYAVILDGEIRDSGSTYVMTGKTLGTFKSRSGK